MYEALHRKHFLIYSGEDRHNLSKRPKQPFLQEEVLPGSSRVAEHWLCQVEFELWRPWSQRRTGPGALLDNSIFERKQRNEGGCCNYGWQLFQARGLSLIPRSHRARLFPVQFWVSERLDGAAWWHQAQWPQVPNGLRCRALQLHSKHPCLRPQFVLVSHWAAESRRQAQKVGVARPPHGSTGYLHISEDIFENVQISQDSAKDSKRYVVKYPKTEQDIDYYLYIW